MPTIFSRAGFRHKLPLGVANWFVRTHSPPLRDSVLRVFTEKSMYFLKNNQFVIVGVSEFEISLHSFVFFAGTRRPVFVVKTITKLDK